ncbi:unnamed protein product [Pleuronectes platessa]|uniref:Uncharacterized protein n=1 Tax=Pleuronectes platessa TaxID=8262 RepID=A0A9N7YZT7_PLEPL|nr:unnamed protein product [Pleuronectes platessa]
MILFLFHLFLSSRAHEITSSSPSPPEVHPHFTAAHHCITCTERRTSRVDGMDEEFLLISDVHSSSSLYCEKLTTSTINANAAAPAASDFVHISVDGTFVSIFTNSKIFELSPEGEAGTSPGGPMPVEEADARSRPPPNTRVKAERERAQASIATSPHTSRRFLIPPESSPQKTDLRTRARDRD